MNIRCYACHAAAKGEEQFGSGDQPNSVYSLPLTPVCQNNSGVQRKGRVGVELLHITHFLQLIA
ncbi:hypothetical protein GCM10007082_20110 [Oceanisphaera arctica]|nr:hypothetical protein GCM10007082_20110 [Oceanisphaera arctica]